MKKKRDDLLSQKLNCHSIKVSSFEGNVLLAPLTVLNGQNKMYRVFSPFKKAFKEQFFSVVPPIFPKPKKREQTMILKSTSNFGNPQQPNLEFPAGEARAHIKFTNFCKKSIKNYRVDRNFPALDRTSRLSPYFSSGILSVKYCAHYLIQKYPDFWLDDTNNILTWFNELIWRDFYQHLIVAFAELSMGKAFIKWTENIIWNTDEDMFDRWKTGATGFPIVDAAMHQLNQTGWMHNRLRMITASFLVKNLLINWRWGEQYFMSKLIDGDLAANNGGWQWAASTGTSSPPFFRIFNPTLQGETFDPKGKFIRRWIPELKKVPQQFIHQPLLYKQKYGSSLNYPDPIISHNQTKKKTVEAFKKAKSKL